MIRRIIFSLCFVCCAFISLSLAATRIINESHGNTRQKRVNPEDTSDRRDSLTDSQQFLPSFGPLFGHLGHSRPPRLYQEPADYLAELNPSYLQTASASNRESAMLGSGNFGVIPGGTYYSAGESSAVQSDPYLYDGNSHGRPHRYVQRHRVKYDNYNNRRFSGNPRPSPFRDPDDFFAGFRDFADITAPTKSSFSQYHMVYAPMDDVPAVEEKVKSKKKRKLNKHLDNENDKTIKAKRKMHAGEKELYEPMIALS